MPWVYIWTKDKIDGPIFVRGGGEGGEVIYGGAYTRVEKRFNLQSVNLTFLFI